MKTRRKIGVVVGIVGIFVAIVDVTLIFLTGSVEQYYGNVALIVTGVALAWLGLMLIGRRRRY